MRINRAKEVLKSRHAFVLGIVLMSYFVSMTSKLNAAGTVLFEDSFETGGLAHGAAPVWSWGNLFDPTKPTLSHMMYGKGDVYEVARDITHTGRYSLRLNFDGRNGFCNVCGTRKFEAKNVGSPAAQLIAEDGSIIHVQSTAYSEGRIFYNRDDSYAKWSWPELRRQLLGQGGVLQRNDMQGIGGINNSDTLLLANQCGIDGTVGGNVSRRSDCDRAINYFERVKEEHFPYGATLARRFYIYIPKNTVLPENTFKLGYVHFRQPNDQGREIRAGSAIVIMVQRNSTLEVAARSQFNKYLISPVRIERDKWYYIEEVWQRESQYLANDAEYWLYAGESGSDVGQPVAHLTGGRLGKLLDMSIHGNWQHLTSASGYVYFDDIRIATQRSGPVSHDMAPASPASLSAYQVHQ